MKRLFMPAIIAVGVLGLAATSHAQITDQSVEYVRICSLYGSAFHYIPGTDTCVNDETGQTRQATEGGVWVSLLPTNNQGHWVTNPTAECAGRLVKIPTIRPSDFRLNAWNKYQVAPFGLKLNSNEFISKIMMAGGFYDPFQPAAANPQLSAQQFCVRTADPNYSAIDMGGPPIYPPFCTPSPLGCFSNSQLLGTPAAYSFPVIGAPPVHYNTDANGMVTGPPQTCGSQIVITTGMGTYNPTVISDPSHNLPVPAAGTLSTWVCVEQGSASLIAH